MINEKIKADLLNRGKASAAIEQKIIDYLEKAPSDVHTLRDICNKKGSHSGSFWAAAYHLAAQGKIGLSDRKYHVWMHSILGTYSSRIRCVVWHIGHEVDNLVIRPNWASYHSETTQPSLFGDNIHKLSSDELKKVIERASDVLIDRALESRYRGSLDHVTAPIKEVLKKVGVADPVALVHADDTCVFLTLTATNAMPLQVTFATKAGNEIAQTQELSHITIHGAPVISTIQQAYKRGVQ